MKLKYFLYITYLGLLTVLFATFSAEAVVWVSFLASAVVVTVITTYHLFVEKVYSPFVSSYLVFTILFFLIAPIVQIGSFEGPNPTFVHNLPYEPGLAIYANVLVSIFNSIFFLAYLYFKGKRKWLPETSHSKMDSATLPMTVIILFALSVLVLLGTVPFVLDELNRPNWQPSIFSTSQLLIYKKVLFMLPFGGIILCMQYLKKPNKKLVNWAAVLVLLALFMALLFWFKNPLTEKRNALGPIYFSLLFLFVAQVFNSNEKTMSFLFFSMIILFPLSAILTHSDATLAETIKNPSILLEEMKGGGITNAFTTLNYDAFANIMTTMDYVRDYGFSYGFQLLSAFLFFVPRGLWEGKPYGSGQLAGDHLIDKYDYNFNNLSNPYVSEGYLNFGVVGVVIFAVVLAWFFVYFLKWLNTQDVLKKTMAFYFAMHLLFLLRGDFTNGYSYYVGILVGVLVIPRVINYAMAAVLKRQQLWKLRKQTT